MIGMITLDRRDAERPGHVRPDAAEAELGYMFVPDVGYGYAAGVRAGTRLVRRRASQRAGGT
jgi:hypothetical protein